MKDGYKEINGTIERTWVAIDDENGYWIERKVNSSVNADSQIPVTCPICSFMMNGAYDTQTFIKYSACERCYIQFIEGRTEQWNAGTRPNAQALNMYIKKRKNKR